MDVVGFWTGIALFAVFVTGFIAYLVLKGTPKFETFLGNVQVSMKNTGDKIKSVFTKN